MTLHEKLVNKIHEEHEQFLAKIEKLPPKEIICKAYEITCREEIVNILENTEFSDIITTRLLELPNPIGILYDEWLHMDCGFYEIFEDMIRNF